jgi:hypothetical protein
MGRCKDKALPLPLDHEAATIADSDDGLRQAGRFLQYFFVGLHFDPRL